MRRFGSLQLITLILTPFAVSACGGGGGAASGSSGGSGAAPSTLDESLGQLGVDTTSTPRMDPMGSELPPNYGPLGTTFDLTRRTELMLAGVRTLSGASALRLKEDTATAASLSDAATLWSEAVPEWPGIEDASPETYEAQRCVVMADVNGDGKDAIIDIRIEPTGLVLRHTNEPGGPSASTAEYSVSGPILADSVELTAADVDGDLKDEIVVAIAESFEVTLMLIDDASTLFAVDQGLIRTFPANLAGGHMSAVLAAGNVDADPGEEIVLVRNEQSGALRVAHYALIDDLSAGLGVVRDEQVQLSDGTGVLSAKAADVAIGDFDGDNVDEILLVGPSEDPDLACGEFRYFGMVIDDGLHGFSSLGGREVVDQFDSCLQNEPVSMWWIPALAVDLDGDRIDEAMVGRRFFELDAAGGIVWRPVNQGLTGPLVLPDDLFFAVDPGQGTRAYHRSTSAFAAGDFDGYATGQRPDGSEELAVTFDGMGEVRVIPFESIGQGSFTLGAAKSMPVGEDNQWGGAGYPMLIDCDVDEDSISLVRTETEHELVFTEPVVLAAIAAPPCSTGIGQNLDATSATLGNTTSQSNASSRTLTATSSATVGFKFDGGVITQSELEVTATLRASASYTTSEAYDLSLTRTFSTGALEDAVVFTTLPMDRYTYRVLQHPDASLEGREIVVDLPRRPIMLQAERSFYNATVIDPEARVGDEVMTHSTGDHLSYKGRGEKNQIIGGGNGLESPLATVGQGMSGVTGTQISVGSSWSTGGALELGYEFAVMVTTGGAVTGYSVGASVESTLSVTTGEETTYSVGVGTIPAATFADNLYSFGLFTYVRRDPVSGRQYQVLDFWVE